MLHTDVFVMFKKLLPLFAEGATEWFPNGKNCIRIRMGGFRQEFIFTFNGNKEWKFETIDNFVKNLNKNK